MDPSIFRPVIEDQYQAAQVYFACVLGMLVIETLIVLPGHFRHVSHRGRPFIKPSGRHNKLRIALHKIATFPSFIPFITNHHAPDILRILVFTFLNVLFGWNRIEFTTDYQLYGWLTIANGGLAMLLGARTNLFTLVLQIPPPVLLMYHRFIGVATVIHATIHFGTTARHYGKTNQLPVVLTSGITQAGLIAWCAVAVVGITAIFRPIRRRSFELFYVSHFFFIVFIGGSLVHAIHGPEFLVPGLALWIIDRVIRFIYNFRTARVHSAVHYPGGVTKIKLSGVKVTRPNQMAWVQVPGVSFFNWHPFTIASAPGDDTVTFAIRGLGGFTKKVQDLATETKPASHRGDNDSTTALSTAANGLRIRVDGPYGKGSLQWDQYPVIVLVAGGIGITPGVSIASHIVRRAASAVETSSLTYGQTWSIHLLWVIKDAQHATWFEDELMVLGKMIQESGLPVHLNISIFVTGNITTGSMGQEEGYAMGRPYTYSGPGVMHKGRPNVSQWMESVRAVSHGLDAAVSLCGPRRLIDDARKAAASSSWEGGLFHVEEEVFEF